MDSAATTNVDALLEQAAWIRALALQLVRDAAAADDVVQETLLAALRHRPSADRPLRPWLARVARNQAALSARADQRRHARETASARTEALPSASELAARAEQQKQLVEAVLELRDPYRSVLLLRYYEGLTPEAIAARQGVPGSTVRNQLARGLLHLRDRLDAKHGGDRRAWSLALVPLAVEQPGHGVGMLSAFATGLLAMQVVTKLLLACCALLLVSAIAFFGCERRAEPSEQLAIAPKSSEPFELHGERTAVEQPPTEVVLSAQDERIETPARAAPKPSALDSHLKGKVVSRRDRKALAEYQILVGDGHGDPEAITTREDGTFESARDYADGALSFTYVDAPGTESLQFVDGGLFASWPVRAESFNWRRGGKLELQVDVGPTFNLRLSAPSRAASWSAAVYSGEPCGAQAVGCERAPVRQGANLWVRCASQAFDDSNRSSAAARRESYDVLPVVITSADGLWRGALQVGSTRDYMVEVEPSARLEIALSRRDHEPLRGPDVFVRQIGNGCVRRGDASWNGSSVTSRSETGEFVFKGLEPGEYEVTGHCLGCAAQTQRVKLRGGKVESIKLVLSPAGLVAYLRGELRSASGEFDKSVSVRVRAARADAEHSVLQRCEFRRERDETIARFEFLDLAPGDYEIDFIQSGSGHQRWTPYPATVTAPGEGLVFVCEDLEPLIDVHLRASFAETDGDVAKARWHYVIDGVEMTAVGPELTIEGVSPRSTFEWCVTARGCGIACGDWNDLSRGGARRFGDARLKRGWGAKIRTVEEDSRVPVSGVVLAFDGEPVGHTNESGVLLIERARAPRQIEATLLGWRPVANLRKLGVVVDDDVQVVFVLPMRRTQ